MVFASLKEAYFSLRRDIVFESVQKGSRMDSILIYSTIVLSSYSALN